jgi:hypothetical protein
MLRTAKLENTPDSRLIVSSAPSPLFEERVVLMKTNHSTKMCVATVSRWPCFCGWLEYCNRFASVSCRESYITGGLHHTTAKHRSVFAVVVFGVAFGCATVRRHKLLVVLKIFSVGSKLVQYTG